VCEGKKSKKGHQPDGALIGPWIHKLHLADNGIDDTCTGDCSSAPAERNASLITCMQMIGQ